MKQQPTYLMAAIAIAACLAACSQYESEQLAAHRTAPLELTTQVAATRAVIDGTQLPYGSNIGVCLLDADGDAYSEETDNLSAVYDDKWLFNHSVELSEKKGYVRAYHPYHATPDRFDWVNVGRIIGNQVEYLYTPEAVEVDADHPRAALTMQFALARVTLRLQKVQDEDHFAISKLWLRDTGNGNCVLNTTGGMNITTGEISALATHPAYNDAGIYTNYVVPQPLFTTPIDVDVLVIPTSFVSGRVQLVITLDNGETLQTYLPAASWEKGKQYVYPISLQQQKVYIGTPLIAPRGDGGTSSAFVPYTNQ